ncbi:MAG: tetratricopeptide repeat protein [Cyanobacteriota bacterium]
MAKRKNIKKQIITSVQLQNIAIIFFIVMFIISMWFYKPYFFEKNPKNLRFIGLYYLRNNDYTNAVNAFKKAARINPTVMNRYYLGDSLIKLGRYDDGYRYLIEALDEEPKNRNIHLSIGDYYLANKKNEKALEYYKNAFNLGPNSKVYLKLGIYYYEIHDTQLAYENLVRSMDLEPDNLEIYPYLAEVYTRKGLFISAFESYEHYLNAKCAEGIPYSYLLSDEAEIIKDKMRELRDLAGEM